MKFHGTIKLCCLGSASAIALAALNSCRDTTLAGEQGLSTPSPAMTRPAGEPGVGQQQFDSDQQAATALLAAVKAEDSDALQHIFGPSVKEFITGDKVEDGKAYTAFVKSSTEHMELEKLSDHSSCIDIGADKWPFPIPLTRLSTGKWFFDTEAGKQEVLDRRIGSNELETIRVCQAYVEAQREYGSQDHNGDGVLQYAQRLISRNGHDGLYWDAAAGEEESPFGPLVAEANMEGYTPGQNPTPQPYHGYYFHILTRQGSAAPAGAYNYIINGRMIAGFALVAWPATYGASGVMTFEINHQGKLYQKDLGPTTATAARTIQEFNPESGWTPVNQAANP